MDTHSETPLNLGGPVLVAFVCWLILALGFVGLKVLMHERPQFAGPSVQQRTIRLEQGSPKVVIRKRSDDVSAVISVQPALSEISLVIQGKRDYRGLKTVAAMDASVSLVYTWTNHFDEPIHILFRAPHPTNAFAGTRGVTARDLRLTSSLPGKTLPSAEGWLWTGLVEKEQALELSLAYEASNLRGFQYAVGAQSESLTKAHRFRVDASDIPELVLKSSDGALALKDGLVWERDNFLAPEFFEATLGESRGLFDSLNQLTETGPVVSLLFLVSVMTLLVMKKRSQPMTIATIAAGYGVYFPLIVYLSARLPFWMALSMATLVPAVLLLNYLRWLLGPQVGFMGGALLLSLFQVFPTLAALSGWNRGLVLLCLGILTLTLLIHLQNLSLKRAALVGILAFAYLQPSSVNAEMSQAILPIQIVRADEETPNERPSRIAFRNVQLSALLEDRYASVTWTAEVEVWRQGTDPIPLFREPVFLVEQSLPEAIKLVRSGESLGLLPVGKGAGVLTVCYRAPVQSKGNRTSLRIPILAGFPGRGLFVSKRSDLAFAGAQIWAINSKETVSYQFGFTGEETIEVAWGSGAEPGAGVASEEAISIYGIPVALAQHLTVIDSQGQHVHFAEFELGSNSSSRFELRLPEDVFVVSAAIDGVEIADYRLSDQVLALDLKAFEHLGRSKRVSLKLQYPRVQLGFAGELSLACPTLKSTTGSVEWSIVIPQGFACQVMSGSLETLNRPLDLSAFGEYSAVVNAESMLFQSRNLVPSGPLDIRLNYHQRVAGFFTEVMGSEKPD